MTILPLIESKRALPPNPTGPGDAELESVRVLPAERFYWGVVSAPGLKARPGPVPPGILAEFALDVPVAVDGLHAVCCQLDADRLLVCAATRKLLEEARTAGGPIALRPERVPEFVDGPVDAAALNLLIGEFEPATVRAARARRHLVRAFIAVAIVLLVAIGLVRREREWKQRASDARAASAALMNAVGSTDGMRRGDLPPLLASLRQATAAAGNLVPPRDAATDLTRVLAAWPNTPGVSIRPQSVSVSDTGIAISLVVEGDPSVLLRAFKPIDGYMFDEPRLSAVTSGGGAGAGVTLSRVSLQLRKADAKGGSRP